MKKALILSTLFLLSSQLDGWSQVGAAGAIKKSARGVAGRQAPAKTGQQGGGTSASGIQAYRPTPTRIPDRTRTPIQQIESALSLIKIKRELTDEHREKLATGMFAAGEASGAKVKPETITKVSYAVADAVNKYKLGYSQRKQLAAALLNTMGAGGFDDSHTKFTIGQVSGAFSNTAATDKELDGITSALDSIIGEQRQTQAK